MVKAAPIRAKNAITMMAIIVCYFLHLLNGNRVGRAAHSMIVSRRIGQAPSDVNREPDNSNRAWVRVDFVPTTVLQMRQLKCRQPRIENVRNLASERQL